MKKILLATFVVLVFGSAFGQSLSYAWHGASAYVQYFNVVAKDGFVYSDGFAPSGRTVDLDPTTGIDTLSDATNDIKFVVKMTENGGYEWARRIKGSSLYINSIATTSSGTLAVVGYSDSLGLDFDPGPAVVGPYTNFSRISFLAFYSAQGNYIGHIEYDGNNMYIYSLEIDASDNLYFGGSISDTLDLDFGPAVDLVPASIQTGFVAEINTATSQYLRTNIFPPRPNGSSFVGHIAAKGTKVSILGSARGHQLDLDPTAGTMMAYSTAIDSSNDWVFYTILDTAGSFLDAASISSRDDDVGDYGLTMDSQGRITMAIQTYTIGNIMTIVGQGNPITFTVNSDGPYYLFSFDATGGLAWHKTLNPYTNVNFESMATNDTIIAILASVNDSVEFGDGTSNMNFGPYPPNTTSRFLALYDYNGSYIGHNVDVPSFVPAFYMASNGRDVSAGAGNAFYMTDRLYYCPCEFDLDPSNNTVSTLSTDTAMINGGAYILRLNLDGFVGTEAANGPQQVLLYPNPANDRLTISSPTEFTEFKVYDLQGRLQLSRSLSPVRNVQLDVTSLAAGMYLIEMANDQGKVSTRFVKQ